MSSVRAYDFVRASSWVQKCLPHEDWPRIAKVVRWRNNDRILRQTRIEMDQSEYKEFNQSESRNSSVSHTVTWHSYPTSAAVQMSHSVSESEPRKWRKVTRLIMIETEPRKLSRQIYCFGDLLDTASAKFQWNLYTFHQNAGGPSRHT